MRHRNTATLAAFVVLVVGLTAARGGESAGKEPARHENTAMSVVYVAHSDAQCEDDYDQSATARARAERHSRVATAPQPRFSGRVR